MSSPGASLLDALHPSTKEYITTKFWDHSSTARELHSSKNDTFEAYWKFHHRECERALDDGGRHILARTHQDVLDVVAALKQGKLRKDIQQDLRTKLTKIHNNENQLIDRCIDLSASLWLMMDFGNIQYGFSGRRQLQWKEDSLVSCVASSFNSIPLLGSKGVKLQRLFNARNLDQVAGVEILPTSNLLDHLRLTDDDTKLYVFYHATFLKYQLSKYGQCVLCCHDLLLMMTALSILMVS